MTHINIYEPRKARPVNFPDHAHPGDFVEITDSRGSTINVWLPLGTAQVVAGAINSALAPKAEAAE